MADRASWTEVLRLSGIRVVLRQSRAAMVKAICEASTDAVILDVGNDAASIAVCDHLGDRRPYAIFVMSTRAIPGARIQALKAGADDHLSADTDPDEMALRIKAFARRAAAVRACQSERSGAVLKFDVWTLDLARQCLSTASGRQTTLSTMPFRLMTEFLKSPGRIFSHQELASACDLDVTHPRFRSHIGVGLYRLRQILAGLQPAVWPLHNVNGRGYRLDTVAESAVDVSTRTSRSELELEQRRPPEDLRRPYLAAR